MAFQPRFDLVNSKLPCPVHGKIISRLCTQVSTVTTSKLLTSQRALGLKLGLRKLNDLLPAPSVFTFAKVKRPDSGADHVPSSNIG
jgi:hypothetical protein